MTKLKLQQYLPFTVLKPNVMMWTSGFSSIILLQQYLPFTVLKLYQKYKILNLNKLQQYLPFTVLKRMMETDIHV